MSSGMVSIVMLHVVSSWGASSHFKQTGQGFGSGLAISIKESTMMTRNKNPLNAAKRSMLFCFAVSDNLFRFEGRI